MKRDKRQQIRKTFTLFFLRIDGFLFTILAVHAKAKKPVFLKINLKEQRTVFSQKIDPGLARVYKLLKNPGETQNVLFPEA